jgi:ABC-type amino acid transport substrate-binding protein
VHIYTGKYTYHLSTYFYFFPHLTPSTDTEIEHYGFEFNIVEYKTWEECIRSVMNGDTDATLVYRPDFYYYMQKLTDPSKGDDVCGLIAVGNMIHGTGFSFAFANNDLDFIHFSHVLIDLKLEQYCRGL